MPKVEVSLEKVYRKSKTNNETTCRTTKFEQFDELAKSQDTKTSRKSQKRKLQW